MLNCVCTRANGTRRYVFYEKSEPRKISQMSTYASRISLTVYTAARSFRAFFWRSCVTRKTVATFRATGNYTGCVVCDKLKS